MDGEVFVGAAEACYEMILEGLDCTLCGVTPMDVWRDELEVYALGADGAFEGLGGFIVELLESGFEATFDEVLVKLVVGSEVLGVSAIFHWFGQNGVAIGIIKY